MTDEPHMPWIGWAVMGFAIFALLAIGYGLGRISAQPETDVDSALACHRVSPREVECEVTADHYFDPDAAEGDEADDGKISFTPDPSLRCDDLSADDRKAFTCECLPMQPAGLTCMFVLIRNRAGVAT